MIVDKILNIKCWTPLNILDFELLQIGQNTFNIGENFYLMVQEYNEVFETGLADAPYVTQAYWAVNDTAFRKTIEREVIDASIFCHKSFIPAPLLSNSKGTYGDLVNSNGAKCFEYATYNSQGEFVCKNIKKDRLIYHFSTLKIDNNELPSVISIKLGRGT